MFKSVCQSSRVIEWNYLIRKYEEVDDIQHFERRNSVLKTWQDDGFLTYQNYSDIGKILEILELLIMLRDKNYS